MSTLIPQILAWILLLFVTKVLAGDQPESYGHECQTDEKGWMKGSKGPPWFSVKCQDGEAKACGFDMAKQKPDKASKTLCPGEYYEPEQKTELFTCTYSTDGTAMSKRSLIVHHFSMNHALKMVSRAVAQLSFDQMKAKATPEYTAWKQKHDDWKTKHEAWLKKHQKWQREHDQWQPGYDAWKEEQDKEAARISVKVAQALKVIEAPVYGEKEPEEPKDEPIEPSIPVETPQKSNWYELRKPLIAALGLNQSTSAKCSAAA